jgi:GNAT superfamily N-acetyltransferase
MGGKTLHALTIRLADLRDVEAMADLHCHSFSEKEHIGILLGARFVQATYRWHVTDPTAYALVAELEGQLIGLLGMCDSAFTGPMFRFAVRPLIWAVLRRPRLLVDRRVVGRFFRASGGEKWVSEFCAAPGVAQMTIAAVSETARGHNVFPRLIQECEVYAAERGSRAIRAGVYRWNAPSQRAFVKRGWPEVPELGSADTVFFLRILDPSIRERFPLLPAAAVREAGPEAQ